MSAEGGTRVLQGLPMDGIQTGERFATSPVTGETYRVTKWFEAGDGKIIAIRKELVENE